MPALARWLTHDNLIAFLAFGLPWRLKLLSPIVGTPLAISVFCVSGRKPSCPPRDK